MGTLKSPSIRDNIIPDGWDFEVPAAPRLSIKPLHIPKVERIWGKYVREKKLKIGVSLVREINTHQYMVQNKQYLPVLENLCTGLRMHMNYK